MKEDIKITYAKEKMRGAVLKIIGVGGGGGKAINRMIEEGLQGVESIVIDTDVQNLLNIKPPAITLQIGEKITMGLGVGSNAELGMQAALENTDAIIEILEGAHMVFITAGMGGGTGTGASQVIASHASSMGILTVAVVTKPFEFEGSHRMKVAEGGIKSLLESVDAMLVIPNQKLFEIEDTNISYIDAYKKVDEILLKAIKGISDIINNAGHQDVNFADVKAVMLEKGRTLMGTGEARGENRGEEAARKALTSPLLDNISIHGATGILYNITAALNLSLKEIGIIADIIKSNAAPDARIKFGIVDDETMGDLLRVTVIATGFKEGNERRPDTRPLQKMITPINVNSSIHNVNAQQSIDEPQKEANLGYYLDKPANTPYSGTNLTGYVNENTLIPSMDINPENGDDLLDVPSFQRSKIKLRESRELLMDQASLGTSSYNVDKRNKNYTKENEYKIEAQSKEEKREKKEYIHDTKIEMDKEKKHVICTVFSPPTVPIGINFLIQVYAHLFEKAMEAENMAKEFDKTVKRTGTKSLYSDIEINTKLTFELLIKNVTVHDPIQSLRWMGLTEYVSFNVEIPLNFSMKNIIGKVIVSKNTVPVGMINFKISIRENIQDKIQNLNKEAIKPLGKVKWYRYAFIAYASEDRKEVLRRVQMLPLLKIDFFQDIFNLRPGSKWKKEIYREIDKADVFFLFWSNAASQSKWVKKEYSYALERKNGIYENPPDIIPVILEGPPITPPPKALEQISFNDDMIYFLN